MRITLLFLLLAMAPGTHALEPFAASYQLLLDGEKKGEARFELEITEDGYSLETLTRPVPPPPQRHEVLEASHGHFDGQRPVPDSYYYAVRTDGKTDMVELFFDWPQKILTLRGNAGQEKYRLEEGTQDRLSYLLRAMALASETRPETSFPKVAADGLERLTLHRKLRRHLTTPAGRFLAQEITIRNGGKRERRLWLAVRRGYLPLALEQQTEQGLVRMELTEIHTP